MFSSNPVSLSGEMAWNPDKAAPNMREYSALSPSLSSHGSIPLSRGNPVSNPGFKVNNFVEFESRVDRSRQFPSRVPPNQGSMAPFNPGFPFNDPPPPTSSTLSSNLGPLSNQPQPQQPPMSFNSYDSQPRSISQSAIGSERRNRVSAIYTNLSLIPVSLRGRLFCEHAVN